MRTTVMLVAVAASAVALAGCGGDDGASTADATATETAATTPPPPPPETTTTTTTTPVKPQAQVVTIRVVGGQPQGGIQRPTIEQGEKAVLVVRSDAAGGVHVHGYDLEKDLVPGRPVRIPFTANLPGRFEVELHPTDTLLAVLEVQP